MHNYAYVRTYVTNGEYMVRWVLYMWYRSSGGIPMGVLGQCLLWCDNSMFIWCITAGRSVLTCGLWSKGIRSGNGTIILRGGFNFWGFEIYWIHARTVITILFFCYSGSKFRIGEKCMILEDRSYWVLLCWHFNWGTLNWVIIGYIHIETLSFCLVCCNFGSCYLQICFGYKQCHRGRHTSREDKSSSTCSLPDEQGD